MEVIHSLHGHDGFLVEVHQLSAILHTALARQTRFPVSAPGAEDRVGEA